jgi:hypothetical protein
MPAAPSATTEGSGTAVTVTKVPAVPLKIAASGALLL